MRIGLIDYLNPAPFYWDIERRLDGRAEFVRNVPSQVNQDLLDGRLQASIVSAHFAAQHADELLVVPGVSVAVRGPVRSVLLFSWEEELAGLAGKRVALTTSSASSVGLLKVLLAEHCHELPLYHRADPDLDSMLADADAALMIGDGALRENVLRRPVKSPGGESRPPKVFDLTAEWVRLAHRPFVFALWAVRRDAVQGVRALDFEEQLKASLAGGLSNLGVIASDAASSLGLDPDVCLSYLENLEYGLGDDLLEGLNEFITRSFDPGSRKSLTFL